MQLEHRRLVSPATVKPTDKPILGNTPQKGMDSRTGPLEFLIRVGGFQIPKCTGTVGCRGIHSKQLPAPTWHRGTRAMFTGLLHALRNRPWETTALLQLRQHPLGFDG